jgi:hypothetical protein
MYFIFVPFGMGLIVEEVVSAESSDERKDRRRLLSAPVLNELGDETFMPFGLKI